MSQERLDQTDLSNLDLSNLKDKLAEAVELCKGDPDCLLRVNQVLSEATDLCLKAISQVEPDNTEGTDIED